MRRIAGFSFAMVGLGMALGANSAAALPLAPAGLRAGIEALGGAEVVHCRRYGHGHRYGHRWSRGCGVGIVVTPTRRSVRAATRSRTIVRTPVDPALRTPARAGDRPPGVNTTDRRGG